jgi:glycosyltransferase involved in cell wall biosynthesis
VRPLRITINTLSITDHNEGILTMITGLVAALVRNDGVNRYRLICSRANEALFEPVRDSVAISVIGQRRRRPLLRLVHDQVTVPWLVRSGADVLLTPSTVGSVLAPVPEVVVVVAHLALPSIRAIAGTELSLVHRPYYGPLMRLSHRRAAAVVAISEFLAGRLRADTGLPDAKVVTIPFGLDPVPPPVGPMAAPADEDPYVLFVGTLYPYKNAKALVRAIAAANPRLARPLRAVVVGRDPDGRQQPAILALAQALGVADRVELVGKVGAAELDALYAGALGLVCPSAAEGFGFTPLEAMARGVPVIVADRTSLPEVVGDAALLVDPDSTGSFADALVRLASEEDLRAHLAAAGRARAAELTWDRAAVAFIEVFRKVARPSASTVGRPE